MALEATQIIRDAFLDNSRPLLPFVTFGDITLYPPPPVCDVTFKLFKILSLNAVLKQKCRNRSKFCNLIRFLQQSINFSKTQDVL
jgi:hypothetical protein